jgi:hypothetical protein
MCKLGKRPRETKRVDLPLIALNIFLIALTAAALLYSDFHFRKSAQAATLSDNRFLNTDWSLMKTLKEHTDQLLQDKDREISELRQRYLALQRQSSSAELLAAAEAELQRAEAERKAILSARFKTSSASPGQQENVLLPAPAGMSPSRVAESGVSELLRQQILKLEKEVSSGRQGTEALEQEIGELRARLSASQGGAGQGTYAAPGSVDSVLSLLEQDRASLSGEEPAFGLADIKTRSLLRAIVRTPAIRSQYPDLVESLDRYFELYGMAERLKGKREAYDEITDSVRTLKAR